MILGALVLAAGALYVGARALGEYLQPAPPAPPAEPPDRETPPEPQSTKLAVRPTESSAAEREVDHHLVVSSVSTGLAAAGVLFFPPLTLLGAAGVVYTCIPIFKRAFRDLFMERQLRISFLDAAAITSIVLERFYFVGALTNTVYFLGRKLLLKTEDQSRRELINLFGEQSRTVWIVKDGVEIEIPFADLETGDLVMVSAGQSVPVDGVIRQGMATLDQRLLTGEAQPIEKEPGDQVFATTMMLSGRACIEVEKTGASTVVAQIGAILNQTADYRSTIDSNSEKVADQSVLPLLGLSAVALTQVGTEGAITVLNSNFVDSLRVALPLGMLNFLKKAARRNILIKDGRAMELLSGIDTVVFDKTGTLTQEQPHLGDIHPCGGFSRETLLTCAAIAEARQSHPIARAIRQAAAELSLTLPESGQVRYQVGYGIKAEHADRLIRVGSARFMAMEGIEISKSLEERQAQAHEQGHSMVYVAIDHVLGGALELRPAPRPEIRQVIDALHARGLSLCIISGDHEAPTRWLAAELGIERYFAEVLPEGKAAIVEKMQREGRKVCFVGDGINDSIALKQATCSVSLSGATTIAVDSAQIVLLDGTLQRLPELFELARSFQTNMRFTLATTIAPSVLLLGGVFFLNFGLYMSLIFYNFSLVGSVANAMLPAWQDDKNE